MRGPALNPKTKRHETFHESVTWSLVDVAEAFLYGAHKSSWERIGCGRTLGYTMLVMVVSLAPLGSGS